MYFLSLVCIIMAGPFHLLAPCFSSATKPQRRAREVSDIVVTSFVPLTTRRVLYLASRVFLYTRLKELCESRGGLTSWAPVPNSSYGFCGRKALNLNLYTRPLHKVVSFISMCMFVCMYAYVCMYRIHTEFNRRLVIAMFVCALCSFGYLPVIHT